jgi:hypothetical protein
MVISSFAFWSKEELWNTQSSERKIEVFKSRITNTDEKNYFLEKQKIITNSLSLGQDELLYVEFGRLSSAMFTSETKNIDTNILTLSGNTIIPKKDYPAIISLYDPFTLYNMKSVQNDYMIRQITNGSFYIWREPDGTLSVYSIDAVIRLDFLDNWSYMTDMVLFPWMYIRFNPTYNRNLAWADLFRIILSMVSDVTDTEAVDRTWVEFVNPRITSANESDTFFMYRLPQYTRVLFRSLHSEFAARVKKLEDLKKYAFDFEYDINIERNQNLSNPSKKNHFLLRELEWLLSQIVNTEKTKEQFVFQLEKITSESKTLAVGNSVETTLEEFLTDARFASFGTANNAHFQEIYDEIAQILKIAPVWAKAELLQKLSNIYSLNLSAQLRDKEFSRIDTYTPTAREVRNTLTSTNIDTKDYFDIALYAFHVLKKAEDGWKYFDEAITANATYELLSTIFLATDRYVKSTNDITAYKSLSIQFYDHILDTLVNSIYSYYIQDDGDRLYFKEKYIADGAVKIDDKRFIDNLRSFDWVLDFLYSSIERSYENETDLRTFLSIKKSKMRLHAFTLLLDKGQYQEYVLNPYVSVKINGVSLPKISDDSETLVRAKITEDYVDTALPEDEGIIGIRNLLGNIPNANLVKEWEFYYVKNAEMEAINPNDKTTISYQLSAAFTSDLKTINEISILYQGKRIYIVTDTKDQEVISLLARVLPNYFISIDSIYAANPNQTLMWVIRLFIDKSRIAIGNNIFPL